MEKLKLQLEKDAFWKRLGACHIWFVTTLLISNEGSLLSVVGQTARPSVHSG